MSPNRAEEASLDCTFAPAEGSVPRQTSPHTKICGPAVARIVWALTDPGGPVAYARRKQELCERIAHADWGTALIAAADKLDRLRNLARTGQPVAPQRRRHYRAAVEQLARREPTLPWNTELQDLIALLDG